MRHLPYNKRTLARGYIARMRLLTPTDRPRLNEVVGIVLFFAAVAMVVALATYSPWDPSWNTATYLKAQNKIGRPGAWFADLSYTAFGLTTLLMPQATVRMETAKALAESRGLANMRLLDHEPTADSGRRLTSSIEDDIEEPGEVLASSYDPLEDSDPIADPFAPTLEAAEPLSRPASPVAAAAPARPMSFGRGRRKEAAAAPPPPNTAPPAEVPAAERSLDPYEPEAAVAETAKPVVDVAAETGTPETDREREARIDEMERALENFGRRRSPDYGRRGRRR